MIEERVGTVVRARSRSFIVRLGGVEVAVVVPKKLRWRDRVQVDPVAVGDRVRVALSGGDSVIEEILPRTNALSRPASGRAGRRQVVAANLDLAIAVLAAAHPAWKPATLDRYLVMASFGGVPGAVCMNKIDLDPAAARAPELEVYPRLGVPVFRVSARTGEGLEELAAALDGRTGVFIGPSGTGKSSLINRLAPDAALPVGEVSDRTRKGQHTTTWTEMLDLAAGGRLVDSPGLRVLDLTGLPAAELAGHFPEIREHGGRCRFQDCRHLSEPGCAVREAVGTGAIAPHRYDSYRRIHRSLEAGEG